MENSYKTGRLWWPISGVGRFQHRSLLALCRRSLLLGLTFIAVTTAHAALPPKLLAGDGAIDDRFGNSVAIDVDTAIVGALEDDGLAGSAYVYERDTNGNWGQEQKLTASDRAAEDYFGISVAVHGDTIVVGAYGNDDNGSVSGSAYVFARDEFGIWTERQKLTASDAAAVDLFGRGVAVHGNTVVVGAYGDDDKGSGSGSVYIFDYNTLADTWNQTAKLTANDGFDNDQLGVSVSIHSDTVVAGAHQDDDNGSGSGSAYVFKRTTGVWSQEAKLISSDGSDDDWFGFSVSVHSDTALIGAQQDDNLTGSAYVFTRNAGIWTEQAKLIASDASAGDFFGNSVSISGNTALVGAFSDDTVIGTNILDMGAAYVYARNTGGIWSEEAKLYASDAAQGDQLGSSVALSGDTALIGARGDDDNGNNSGSVYVFRDAFPADPTEWLDTDDDGTGDNTDTDDDNDGLLDLDEVTIHGTQPLLWDSDNDGFGDGYEISAGTDPLDDQSIPMVPDGDVNGDGLVDLADLLLAMRILTGQYTPTPQEQARWDVAPLVGGVPAPDGFNNSGDYTVLQQKVLGIISF